MPCIRDRVVQTAAKWVLEPIFEADFLELSYGFRPKRNAIMALEVIRKRANAGSWFVVDADVRAFFDNVSHWKLLYLVDQRVNDPQMRKAIKGFLKAGVLDGDAFSEPAAGTPQGGPVSPLLANIYLNFLDHVFQQEGRHLGEMVRYADDLVILCRTREDAEGALELLKATTEPLGSGDSPGQDEDCGSSRRERRVRFFWGLACGGYRRGETRPEPICKDGPVSEHNGISVRRFGRPRRHEHSLV